MVKGKYSSACSTYSNHLLKNCSANGLCSSLGEAINLPDSDKLMVACDSGNSHREFITELTLSGKFITI